MKKILIVLLILLIALFTACSENQDELYATIAEQASYIEELRQALQEQSALQQEHLDTIAQLQAEAEAPAESEAQPETESALLWHGLTEADVRADFFQNAEALVRHAVGEVGEGAAPLRDEDVTLTVSEITVQVLLPREGLNQSIVFLSYWRDWDNYGEIIWDVTGYGATFFNDPLAEFLAPMPPYIISARPPVEARQLTDLETVTLPFSPLFMEDSEDIKEVIAGEALWEETIRLVREHYGVQIRDIWYDGQRLYVEMMPIMAGSFNSGIGSMLHGDSVRRTFEAFPDVTEVRFLVLGRRFTAGYLGYDINCVYPCRGSWDWERDEPLQHTCLW